MGANAAAGATGGAGQQDPLQIEVDRLTRLLVGQHGLDPEAWPHLPTQIARLAHSNIKRAANLAHLRHALDKDPGIPGPISRRPHVAASRHKTATSPKSGVRQDVRQPVQVDRYCSASWACSQKAAPIRNMRHKMEAMRTALAASIVGRMQSLGASTDLRPHDDLRHRDEFSWVEGMDSASRDGSESAGSSNIEFAQHLAKDMKAAHRVQSRSQRLLAQASRVAAQGNTRDDVRPGARGDEEPETDGMDAPQDGSRANSITGLTEGSGMAASAQPGLQRTSSVRLSGSNVDSFTSAAGRPTTTPRISTSRASGTEPISATVRARQALLARAKKVVTPLVQVYLDACASKGITASAEVSAQLEQSESSNVFAVTGVALPDLAATTVAEVLAKCKHLKGVSFARTVLNPGAVAALIPACWQLRLTHVNLVATDMTADCWPTLLAALQRPVESAIQQPSEWWLTLQSLSLAGNPLGDEGITLLTPALTGLEALTQLDLSQTGITDWSAPQLEVVLRQSTRLQALNLSHNQLGILSGQALAGALPTTTNLTRLDLSWNPLGGGLAPIAWSIIAPRSEHNCRLIELKLCGVDMRGEDHLAVAALLKWGHGWLPLQRLDLSHNNLVGVGAQCLLRQLNAVLQTPGHPSSDLPMPESPEVTQPQAQPQPQQSGNPVPKLDIAVAATAVLAALRSENALKQDDMLTGRTTRRSGRSDALTSLTGLGPVTHMRAASGDGRQPKLDAPFAAEQQPAGPPAPGLGPTPAGTLFQPGAAGAVQAEGPPQPGGLRIITLGCRVDLDGGEQPTPRSRLGAGVAGGGSGKQGAAGAPHHPVTAGRRSQLQARLQEMDPHDAAAQQAAAAVTPERPLQRFVLDLAVPRPDHHLAQLLVEHELDGRRHHCTTWHHAQLDARVFRQGGKDVFPMDPLYEGWGHPGTLPKHGTLILDVACLPRHASAWLQNPRLHFNVSRLLQEKRGAAESTPAP